LQRIKIYSVSQNKREHESRKIDVPRLLEIQRK